MRAKRRDELIQIVDEVVRPLLDGRMQGQQLGRDAQTQKILQAVADVKPASVDLTQEMADDIVRKIHGPLTIGQNFSDWIRQEASRHDVFWTAPLGYGSMAGQMLIYLKTNGTLQLEMRDHVGERLWFGTFVPPGFGKQS